MTVWRTVQFPCGFKSCFRTSTCLEFYASAKTFISPNTKRAEQRGEDAAQLIISEVWVHLRFYFASQSKNNSTKHFCFSWTFLKGWACQNGFMWEWYFILTGNKWNLKWLKYPPIEDGIKCPTDWEFRLIDADVFNQSGTKDINLYSHFNPVYLIFHVIEWDLKFHVDFIYRHLKNTQWHQSQIKKSFKWKCSRYFRNDATEEKYIPCYYFYDFTWNHSWWDKPQQKVETKRVH